jgi:hypothetical protein
MPTATHPAWTPPSEPGLRENRAATHYCVTIDTEEEWDWSSGYPTQSDSVENIRQLARFQDVLDSLKTKVTYFTNYTVLANPRSRAVIQDLSQRPNVEIGLHLHPWNTPPFPSHGLVSPRESYLHNLPWPLALAKLDSLMDAAAVAGIHATSYRGGRYSTSPQIQNYLRDHGIIADSSIMPWTTWKDDGAPDYRSSGPLPNRLAPRFSGDSALWELPLTFGYVGPDYAKSLVAACDRSPFRQLKAGSILERLTGFRKCWLNLENPLGEGMTDLFPSILRQTLPFVCFTMHSSSLIPGGSPYVRTQADLDRLMERATVALKAAAAQSGFQSSTVSETVHSLEAAHAGHRH